MLLESPKAVEGPAGLGEGNVRTMRALQGLLSSERLQVEMGRKSTEKARRACRPSSLHAGAGLDEFPTDRDTHDSEGHKQARKGQASTGLDRHQ